MSESNVIVPEVPKTKPSIQNKLAKRIFDYWVTYFQQKTSFRTVCDQAATWSAQLGSPERARINLFTGTKGRGTWIASADVAVIDEGKYTVPYLVEIEAHKFIKPKIPMGLVAATNVCSSHYRRGDNSTVYDLSNAVLFVVLCSAEYGNPRSRKRKQLDEIRDKFDPGSGCLRSWHICEGIDVDAAFECFETTFKKVIGEQSAE